MGRLKSNCQWNCHAFDNGDRHVGEQIVENGFFKSDFFVDCGPAVNIYVKDGSKEMVQRDCSYGVQVACNVKSTDMHAMRSIWCLCLSVSAWGCGVWSLLCALHGDLGIGEAL
jgi:hypothetical protein